MEFLKLFKKIAIIVPFFVLTAAFGQKDIYFNLSELFPLADFSIEKGSNYTIVALNKDGQTDQEIEGFYKFSINGYIEDVKFYRGRAALKSNFSDSPVLYVKHEREGKASLEHLFYSYGSTTVRIPFWTLLIIPILIIVLAIIVKRLIVLILLIGFVLFFVMQGMDLDAFVQLIKDAISKIS